MKQRPILPALVLALTVPALAVASGSKQAPSQVPAAPGIPTAPRSAGAQPVAQPPQVIVPIENERGASDTRDRLRRLLDQYPPSVRQVLRIDTSLLSRPEYLATYPALAAFLEQHPEVAHNPRYFVGDPGSSGDERPQDSRVEALRTFKDFFDLIPVMGIVFIITSAVAGLIRTLLDQHRWRRATQIQMDFQNKLIDRFSNSGELLSYLQSPAGRGLVDVQAPAPATATGGFGLFSGSALTANSTLNRVFWPLQAGIVLASAGIGLNFFGRRMQFFEMSEPITGIGALVVAIGIGFMLSAAASLFISHRLGLVQPVNRPHANGEIPGA